MARGDVVSAITSVATGANLDFQPAAGVEVMITEIGSDKYTGSTPDTVPQVTVQLYDGANASVVRRGTGKQQWTKPLKLFLNNTNYLRLTNDCGIQTK